MPIPVSLTRTTTSSPSRPAVQGDRAAGLGVLRGVVQQVDDHLLQPDRVGLEPERADGEPHREPVLALVDEGPGRLDGRGDDRGQGHRLQAEPDLAPGDPGDVEQVVDQPGHEPDLLLDDRPHPSSSSGSPPPRRMSGRR